MINFSTPVQQSRRRFLTQGRARLPALLAVLALCAASCTDGEPQFGSGNGADGRQLSDVAGWRLTAPDGLNSFFDCVGDDSRTLISAHRGGPSAGFPENALETFAETLRQSPALIELDVATSADGVLFLMHDDTLDRTTDGTGVARDTPWQDIARLHLVDDAGRKTPFHPPRFVDALAFLKERTITQIDFKRSTSFTDVIDIVRDLDAEDRVILIAYSIPQAAKLHRLAPELMISLSLDSASDLNRAVAAGLPPDRLLAFTGLDAPLPRFNTILEDRDIEVIFGTLGGRRSIDRAIEADNAPGRYVDIARTGVDILATDRPAAAHAALKARDQGPKGCGITQASG